LAETFHDRANLGAVVDDAMTIFVSELLRSRFSAFVSYSAREEAVFYPGKVTPPVEKYRAARLAILIVITRFETTLAFLAISRISLSFINTEQKSCRILVIVVVLVCAEG